MGDIPNETSDISSLLETLYNGSTIKKTITLLLESLKEEFEKIASMLDKELLCDENLVVGNQTNWGTQGCFLKKVVDIKPLWSHRADQLREGYALHAKLQTKAERLQVELSQMVRQLNEKVHLG
jgi:hypothetical protein